ncbi:MULTISPECIES: fimbrial protein [Burkholderia]|uniref:fimbrial protein n=1 Tax=Burkholderia TaxID=32008 RepID=UPI00155968DE|nr:MULTISPECIES: fimbrial protein [Burkholderia]MBG0880228.1 type 1 fimbrial protein [Burkholderia sp. 9775_39]MBG0886339.1 type 1 fimbrial protein [Burkholderia sp. 9773_38]
MSAAYYACLAIGAILPATAAAASDCYIQDQNDNKRYTPMVAQIPALSPPSFSPSVPVGTVLIRVELPSTGESFKLVCGTGIRITTYTRDGVQGAYNTWPTNVAGVGVRMQFTGSVGGGRGIWWPYSYDTTPAGTSLFPSSRILLVEFVKTGPISAGGSLSGEIGAAWAQNMAFKFQSFQVAGSGITITPRVPTCNVREKTLNVPLGDISANQVLPTVGSTSDAKPFKIVLDCDGGEEGSVTKTYMTLTDVSNNANRSDTLTLSPESTAKGLGVQILNGTKLVSYGPDSSVTGNPNQFYTGTTQNGVLEIPLSARYVRTGMVLGGSVTARASFTMSYQ